MDEAYASLRAELDAELCSGGSFDMLRREVTIGGGLCGTFYFVDGMIKDEIMEKLMEYFITADGAECFYNVPYVEVEYTREVPRIVTAVLSGSAVLLAEGVGGFGAIIDARTYPVRSIGEPENDRVLRGARDGFCETIVFNTALIRRRIRDPRLTMRLQTIGGRTKTDIVLCYVSGEADARLVERLWARLEAIDTDGLAMGQEALAARLIGRAAWNPFPKVRYTERPDSAASALLEGSVLLICDNTPAVMILPVSLFDFLQEADDYCFPPLTGSYLRLVRLAASVLSVVLVPLWYMLVRYDTPVPAALGFIKSVTPAELPLFFQLLLTELAVDGLKLASLNTPDALSHSLGVVGGLILGDFAVTAGWFSPETILYAAFTAITSFTQRSYELGYALKFIRIGLITLGALLGWWGIALGGALTLLLLICNRSISGARGYLYPLIPFDGAALARLVFRLPPRGGRRQGRSRGKAICSRKR